MSEKHKLCRTCVHTRCQLGTHAYMQVYLEKGCGQYQPREKKPLEKKPPITNFDRISASPEALAEFMADFSCESCPAGECDNMQEPCDYWLLKWLKQEAKDDER